MSKVDDELTRRLRRADRPVGSADLFEELAGRRRRRRTLQRLQAGALAVAVLAATGGGFAALQQVFRADGDRDIGSVPILPEDGTIVFSAESRDGYVHIYAIPPDRSGRQLITDFGTDDTDPTVSPDGRTIAFVHQLEDVPPAIATIPIQGGSPTWLTDESFSLTSGPSWSPDGSRLVVSGSIDGRPGLYIVGSSERPRPLATDPESEFAGPDWSPTGERIVYSVRDAGETAGTDFPWTIQTIRPDGVAFTLERQAGKLDEHAPTWSPDGTRIAFIRAGGEGDEIWTMAADGSDETLVAIAVEATLERDLAWAPDGSSLLVSDGEWIYGVAATPEGDPRANFVQLVRGFTPTWHPISLVTEPSAAKSPDPGASPSPSPEARDIGLGFLVCHLQRLDGIDWYGGGTLGTAWTGARATGDGRCPAEGKGEYVVAADLDGDGRAEPGGMGFLEFCLLCHPFAATDLSGDGVLELVVLEQASSTPSYSIYEVSVPTSERSPGIYSLSVAPPGAPRANLPPDEPIRLTVGGDEGFSGGLRCENHPEAPVIVYTWFFGEVDADTDLEVHVTRLRLGEDSVFHVVASEDSVVPRGAPPTIPTAPACGVDFHPAL